MDHKEILEKLKKSFQGYYNIKTEDVTAPFAMEAEFHTTDVNYFLSKSAKIFESNSNEYVFFASEENLTKERFQELDEKAWSEGLSRVNLEKEEDHKSTDVTLIILADSISEECFKIIKKTRHYKSYAFTLKGWSNYRLIALEVSTGKVVHNRQGESLKKLLCNIVA